MRRNIMIEGNYYHCVTPPSDEFIAGWTYRVENINDGCAELLSPMGKKFSVRHLGSDEGIYFRKSRDTEIIDYLNELAVNTDVKDGGGDEMVRDIPDEDFRALPDPVEHPSHYTWLKDACGIEVIDITRHMDFDLGNAVKYILRAGHKPERGYTDKEKMIEDLRKAMWYINDKTCSMT